MTFNEIYTIKKDEWLEGYDLYYKIYRRKFTYIKAAFFLIPLLLFIEQVIIDPTYALGWVCIVVCVFAISVILTNPKLERKTTERALDSIIGRKYKISFDGEKFVFSEEIPQENADGGSQPVPTTELLKTSKGLRIEETENIIGIFTKSVRMILPKSDISQDALEAIRAVKNGNM